MTHKPKDKSRHSRLNRLYRPTRYDQDPKPMRVIDFTITIDPVVKRELFSQARALIFRALECQSVARVKQNTFDAQNAPGETWFEHMRRTRHLFQNGRR